MVRLQQIKLKIPHTDRQLLKKVCKLLAVDEQALLSYRIARRSLDARRKPELFYVYTVEAELKREAAVKKKIRNKNIQFLEEEKPYVVRPAGKQALPSRPAVIGTGPAGLFCGYQLARLGYRPILIERGAKVRERIKDVERFWNGGSLDKNSNVQFGEGGAGTFSDGKLNTLVHDDSGRNQEVLRIFHAFGAPEQILYDSKPHIGTDILCGVVERMREEIVRLGGEVWFHSCVEDFELEETADGARRLRALILRDTKSGEIKRLETSLAVLAVGHSARDTFQTLHRLGVKMQAKSFAVGVRVEHPQAFINENQYGRGHDASLPAAPYKLAAKAEDGRGVYTFCMCPGGYVVNASSEEGRLAVNGMSYSKRDGENANSAVIVTVTPADFGSSGPLSGMEFQKELEEAAYREGNGKIPAQRFKDYRKNRPSSGEEDLASSAENAYANEQDATPGKECACAKAQDINPGKKSTCAKIHHTVPRMKGAYTWANVRRIFPENLAWDIEQGILKFDEKIKGYARGDAILSGVESRTSSPLRILRDESFQSSVKGLYPCGEGAGYAGGITSAAIDGLKVTESIIKVWRPFDNTDEP